MGGRHVQHRRSQPGDAALNAAAPHAAATADSRRSLLIASSVLLAAIAVLGRWWQWDFVSRDIAHFLNPWTNYLGRHGFPGLATVEANYNPPYLYLLLIGKTLAPGASAITITKVISTLFDVALAAAAVAAVARGKGPERWLVFLGLLALPTVWINSAFWGQCDAIYTFWILVGILLLERQRTLAASIAFTTALAFKLQLVFAGPALLAALWVGRHRLAAVAVAVLTYLAWMWPSVIAGRSWSGALSIYLQQATSESDLSFGAPNLWTLVKYVLPQPQLQRIALAAGMAVAVAFALFWVAFSIRRLRQSPQHLMALACTSAFVVPFLLPKMHDRYFFVADILALVLAMRDRRWLHIAWLVQIGSLTAYLCYLTDLPGPLVRPFGIVANCVALVLVARYWLQVVRAEKPATALP